MPSAHRAAVKPNFQTGDFPTQAQFYQWMDWIVFDDEFNSLWFAAEQSQPLTGFVAGGSYSPITATDTTFQALQKIQGNFSNLGGSYIPLAGTLNGYPLTGPVEVGNTGTALWQDSGSGVGYYIGSGNISDLGSATTSSKIYFSPTGTVQITSEQASFVSLSISTQDAILRSSYASFAGFKYFADYSANYTARSLVDKGYVTTALGSYLPLTGGPMTGTIVWNHASNNKTALGSITKDFYVGAGDNIDLASATVGAYHKYGIAGGYTAQSIFASNNLMSLVMNSSNMTLSRSHLNQNTYIQFSDTDILIQFQDSQTTGFYTNTRTYLDRIEAKSINTAFYGFAYESTSAGYVTTNQTQYSLLHRAAGDARWAQLSGATFTGNVNLSNLTASRALITDGSKNIAVSAVTSTELGYVSGVTSAIQTQLDAKLNLSGGTMTGFLTLNADPTSALHAATKQYVDAAVVGLWDDRGTFDASGGAYPSSGGSGTAGAILKGDIWTISVAGTLPTGQVVNVSDTVRALTNTPGNTQANWAIGEGNLGYTPLSNVLTSSYIFVGNGSNVATGVALSGDATISNAGALSIGALKVTNAMLAGSIAYSKLSLTGAILNADLAGSIAYSKLSLTGAILNADLAGSIADGKLASSYIYADGSRALTADWAAGAFNISSKNQTVNGTAGAGYMELLTQSADVAAGATNSVRLFSKAGLLAWVKASDGFIRSFTSTLTANRTYTLPDYDMSFASLAGTETLTNKRVTTRTGTVASSATPTINTDNVDRFTITALAAAITSMTTNLSGTPIDGDLLEIRFNDNGTARAITWGTSYDSTTAATLPTTTTVSTTMRVLLEWNSTTSKWECIAVN